MNNRMTPSRQSDSPALLAALRWLVATDRDGRIDSWTLRDYYRRNGIRYASTRSPSTQMYNRLVSAGYVHYGRITGPGWSAAQ